MRTPGMTSQDTPPFPERKSHAIRPLRHLLLHRRGAGSDREVPGRSPADPEAAARIHRLRSHRPEREDLLTSAWDTEEDAKAADDAARGWVDENMDAQVVTSVVGDYAWLEFADGRA